jgi:hypothetical protein
MQRAFIYIGSAFAIMCIIAYVMGVPIEDVLLNMYYFIVDAITVFIDLLRDLIDRIIAMVKDAF